MQENYQKLEVWKKSMGLVELVYALVKRLPKEETYALSDQIRRAVVSIPSNIAEGQSRGSKEFVQFLKIARGSRAELETQLLICERLKYLTKTDIESSLKLLEEISKMISSLIKHLTSKV
uniref:four helix bundle protein n=1 Tax=Fibrobacteraceae TaxID=204431 RepID=UPI00099AA930|nr:four helix bundle protein [Fibrobacter intestinalis]